MGLECYTLGRQHLGVIIEDDDGDGDGDGDNSCMNGAGALHPV